MNKLTATILIAALAAGGAALAGADDGWRGHGEHQGSHCKNKHMGKEGHDRLEPMMEGLDLTAEQRAQVAAIVDQAKPALNDLQDRMGENRKQLQALTQADAADEAAIRALADEAGKLKAEMIVQRSRMQIEINKVLTPEQREQWKMQRSHDGWGHKQGHEHGHMEGHQT
jgi:Spy/CpxP family protein refolding chaperone